jgi:hypothetical protein
MCTARSISNNRPQTPTPAMPIFYPSNQDSTIKHSPQTETQTPTLCKNQTSPYTQALHIAARRAGGTGYALGLGHITLPVEETLLDPPVPIGKGLLVVLLL